MRTARDLLRLLTEKWPPDGMCTHALTLSDGGFGENAGEVKVSVRRNGSWDCFFIEETDLEKDAAAIVAEIEALIRARDAEVPPPSSALPPSPPIGVEEIRVSGEQKRGDGNCA